ncbi:hypothetical protein WJX84_004206, partial [Apatococcus fuscideae]
LAQVAPPPPPAVAAAAGTPGTPGTSVTSGIPPPSPVAATPPPPPVAATLPPPPPAAVPAATTAPAPQAPPVTAVPAVAAPPPVQPPPPAVTAAPAPKAVATPPAAPVVTAAPAPQAVATPPVTAAPVVTAAPAPKAAATPPVTAAPVAKAAPVAAPTVTPVAPVAKSAPAPAPAAATIAKAAPGPAPSSGAVLPGVLPFPLAPAPAPASPPRQCSNGAPRCKIFVEDTLCCGRAEGLVTDQQYLTVDVLCTEAVVLPVGCLTVAPTLSNITVTPTFQPAGVSSTFHDYIVDFQNAGNFAPGPFSGAITLTLEALRNASSPNYNPTCAQAISPCTYNGTLYNQTLPTFPVAVTVLETLDYVEGYIGLPPTPTDTLGFSVNATNPAICGQADVGALPPSFYTGGFVNYTGFQNACNTTRNILDTYQFCEDYTIPAENRTLGNLPPAPPAPRVPGPSLGPSSKDGIRLF